MTDIEYDGEKVRAIIENATYAGLVNAGLHLLQVSSDRAPHEEGTLADSGTLTEDEDERRVAVAFDTPYARRQHEELTWRHDEGKTAKYLEGPMHEEREVMLAMIAEAGRMAI